MIQDGITLTQTEYSNSVVKTFGQEHCKRRQIPIYSTYDPEDDQHDEEKYPVREAIGSLMYLANNTRPDIDFAVNSLACHVSTPNKKLWKNIQHIIKYIKEIAHLGLTFKKENIRNQWMGRQ